MKLSREIRFALTPVSEIRGTKPENSWAGWPSGNLVVPHLVLRAVISGEPTPSTGYLCNIKVIDELLRSVVTKRLIPKYDGTQTAEEIVRICFREFASQWEHHANIVSIHLALSPFISYAVISESSMNQASASSQRVQLTQQFEFSAAHRLHCNELSDTENQELFGKCNNLEGHGHNYVVEVTVSNKVESDNGHVIAVAELESTVKRIVIDRLDHKHLNRDIDYFANVNPTVENITQVIFDWLDGNFGSARLEKIRVYETPKTWAERSRTQAT